MSSALRRLLDGEPVRACLVVAHPDDETVGAGGHLPAFRDPAVVHLTEGVPRDPSFARAAGTEDRSAYGDLRRAEVACAMAVAGVPEARRTMLRLIDQEVVRELGEATRAVGGLLADVRPEVVLTHAYEGGHPDHDAAAFAVHAAVRLRRERGDGVPIVAEMAGYHLHDGRLRWGRFLPVRGRATAHRSTVILDDAQLALKRRMLACYRSQRSFLAAVDPRVERFRVAPTYDFTAPPHPGPLGYETFFTWSITGARWRRLAASAMHELGLAGGAGPWARS